MISRPMFALTVLLTSCTLPPPVSDPSTAQADGASSADPASCDRACANYANCRGIGDPSFATECSGTCRGSAVDPAVIEQAAGGDCPTVIGLFEGGGETSGEGAFDATTAGGEPGLPPASGGVVPGASPAGAACSPPTGKGPQDAQLAQLLASSPWCHFSFSGSTTRNERVVLFPDGRFSLAGDTETSRSGELRNQYGDQTATYGSASQATSGDGGCWKVDNAALYVTQDGANWVNLNASLTQNSSGYPIITASGKEYAQCK